MAKIDDSVKKKVPELRFKGFTDPWVQRNLADLSDGFSYGLNAAAKEYDGVHGYLRITDIDEVSHSFLPEGLTSPDVPEDQLTDYRMDEQSIVYARTGASTGKTYICRDSDGELYYAGFLIRQKVNKETSAQFVYQNTLTKAWERYVQVMSQRSGQPGINAQEVGRFELAIPEKAEQDKIAHLFNSLDNLIAANQRKLDLLKEQKKGYLQKMFPKNGAKVPELRFAGFADDWEQRKLTEIVNRVNKSSNSDVLPKVEFEDIVSGEGRLNKDISSKLDSRKGTLFESENILYGKLRPYLKNWLFPDFEGVALGDFWVFEATDVSVPSFDYYLIQSDDYQKVANDTSGTKMPRSDWKNVSSTDFAIPSKDEQKQIGAFFKQLDDTITLHQRKLDLLKEQKKGFLQNMFV
ncbi:Type I restriction-modification system, specificity subunit S [Lacticaseibacillus paracasei subsp. paracasei Lpp120]|nr:Type I restriction-modification system, specificity subunit S [Lacticaseibacillus paracasei subsp. paracasei Lpp120]